MTKIYYFKNDGRCKYTKTLLEKIGPKYLIKKYEPGINYYANIEWLSSDSVGVDLSVFKKYGVRTINKASELPENSGILLISYEGDIREIEKLKKNGVNILNKSCPWTSYWMKNELKKVKPTHQLIWLIDENHIAFKNYNSLMPSDGIRIDLDDFEDIIASNRVNKPIHFITYCTYRPKDSQKVVDHIKKTYPDKENIYYTGCHCFFIKSGLFEEINTVSKEKKLDEIWVITGSKKNQSLKSIINEIEDTGLKHRLISNIEDIPDTNGKTCNIGVLRAPMPYSKENEIMKEIELHYPDIIP